MNKRMNWPLAGVIGLFLWSAPSRAITNCFDYVAYRLNPNCQEETDTSGKPVHRIQYDAVKHRLLRLGYTYHDALNVPPAAVQSQLKPGDVVIINHAHVAIVNQRGGIDHFLQTFTGPGGASVDYPPGKLPGRTLNPQGSEGGLFQNETYQQLLDHRPKNLNTWSIEVWKRPAGGFPYRDCPKAEGDLSGSWSFKDPDSGREIVMTLKVEGQKVTAQGTNAWSGEISGSRLTLRRDLTDGECVGEGGEPAPDYALKALKQRRPKASWQLTVVDSTHMRGRLKWPAIEWLDGEVWGFDRTKDVRPDLPDILWTKKSP